MRLGIVVSHPIQYYAPLFRELAQRMDVHVFYGQLATAEQQAAAGFGMGFEWDIDLTSGYSSSVLKNVAPLPNVSTYRGCDVPSIGSEFQKRRIDAVLVVGWYQKVFLQAAWAAKRLRLPVLARGDSQLGTPISGPRRFVKEISYPFFLRSFSAALYVGKRSREYYEHYSYPSSRLFFSPHCVDNEWFFSRAGSTARAKQRLELGISPETPVILFAGKLLALKGPSSLVRATAILRSQGKRAELMLAGSGPLAEELSAQAASLGVPLHALGFCNQSVMPSVYSAADVLALPSEHETWGLVCNEALACGTPIVVSDQVGCAPDLASDDCVGRQFAVGDDRALATALGRTLGRPPSQKQIAAVSSFYSVAAAVDGIELALSRLGNRRKNALSKSSSYYVDL